MHTHTNTSKLHFKISIHIFICRFQSTYYLCSYQIFFNLATDHSTLTVSIGYFLNLTTLFYNLYNNFTTCNVIPHIVKNVA